jgi:adenosyl cobinamide kinase/adenosyl cobinamide phosphate guanylyltransferase
MILCESSLEIDKEFQDEYKKKHRKDRKKEWKDIHNKPKEEDRME